MTQQLYKVHGQNIKDVCCVSTVC